MAVHLKPLSEQTIVVTGASSGIGLTIARRAAERDAKVILVSRNEDALRETAEDIRNRGGQADFVAADVGVREEVRHVVETTVARHGGFDTWVNDAGVGLYAKLEDTPDEDHEQLFQTNYWGVVYGSTEALKHLRMQGGALINIGSIASDMGTPVLSAYAASKHAVKGFTNSLRMELIHDRAPVSVTLIKPSGINTPYGDHAKNFMQAASRVPPPFYHPDLVARAVLRAAETPTREITVGGAGQLQVWFAEFLPQIADRLYAWAFFKTARDPNRPKRTRSALEKPGEGGRQLGDQSGYMRTWSLWTAAQTNPAAALALAAGAGLVVAGLASSRRGRRDRYAEAPRRDTRPMSRSAQRVRMEAADRAAAERLAGYP